MWIQKMYLVETRKKNNGDSHLAPRFDRVAVRWAEETLRYFRSRAGLARELQVV